MTAREKPAQPVSRIQKLAVAEIRCDFRVQPREHLNPSIVDDYCDLMLEGEEFPPLLVVLVDQTKLLVDGHHRLEGAKRADIKELQCEIRTGTLRDAILLGCGVNARHGLRRTWADKRRAVGRLLADPEWTQWSDREIARRCHVSPPFVARLRAELPTAKVVGEIRRYRHKTGTTTIMQISSLRQRPNAVDTLFITRRDFAEPEADVINLSKTVEDHRARFLQALSAFERAISDSSFTIIRGDPAADHRLYMRLKTLERFISRRADWIIRRR